MSEKEVLIEAEDTMQKLLDNCDIFIDSIKEIESSNISDRTKFVAIEFIRKEIEKSEEMVESIMKDVQHIQHDKPK